MKANYATRCLNCKKSSGELLQKGVQLLRNSESEFSICLSCVELAKKSQLHIASNTNEEDDANESKSFVLAKSDNLPWPKDIYDAISKHVQGQEEVKRKLSSAISKHLRNDITGKSEAILILGPSGTGKTECLRAVEKELGIPVLVQDATDLTTSGYVGEDVVNMIRKLAMKCNGDKDLIEKGIIFVDEFDKKAIHSSSGSNPNIGTAMVQDALLKMIEGHKYELTAINGKRITVDSSKIMFVFAGAFSEAEKKNLKYPISENNELTLFLKDYGIKSEFIRRLTGLCLTKKIDIEILRGVYEKKENSIKTRFMNLMYLGYGITVKLSREFEKSIIEKALEAEHPIIALERAISNLQDNILFEQSNNKKISIIVDAKGNSK